MMVVGRVKCLLVAAFSVLALVFSMPALAQHEGGEHAPVTGGAEHVEKIDAAKVIMEHIMDNHEFHLAESGGHPVSIPLPV
ncbi:MAG TPA: F0F1 ATP synthase subunit A, partial [Flavisolibacter sp.]|nr:F0F1 ATP synthase subunit A [Flavisolibacter sp.]